MTSEIVVKDDEIIHFGVKGMKWGNRKAAIKSAGGGRQAVKDGKAAFKKEQGAAQVAKYGGSRNKAFAVEAGKVAAVTLMANVGARAVYELSGRNQAVGAGAALASNIIQGAVLVKGISNAQAIRSATS